MIAEVHEIKRVAVVDDDPTQAGVMSELVYDAGYEPVFLQPPFADTDELVRQVRDQAANAAICDHRLRPRGFAAFDGASAVAALMIAKIPSLLVTQFLDIDSHVSIRRWRHHIPVLLTRDGADAESIFQGLKDCLRELGGEPAPDRRPWRVLIQVDEVDRETGDAVADVHIPSWNPHEAVRFPLDLVQPESLRASVVPGAILLAHVNIGAERAEDLYFMTFETAPEPVSEGDLRA